MSKSRILLRIILVAMILGLGYIAYHLWSTSRPGYYWSLAEQSIEAEEYESAEIFLGKLLTKHKDHDRGWEALSQTLLRRARIEGRPATFAANPDAATAVAQAARLRPSDLELQKRALYAYLELGQYAPASEFAEIVYRADPTDGDANFALTWKAVTRKDRPKAATLFQAFPNITSRHIFSTLTLQSMYYTELNDLDAYHQTLRRAADMAAELTAEQFALLDYRDRQAMLRMLVKRQLDTSDPVESLRRSKAVIDASKKLSEGKLLEPRLLAYTAAESIAHFYHKFPATRLESAHRVMRDELASQAEELGRSALQDAERAPLPMLVYWNTARSLMARGNLPEALDIAEKGLAQADKLGNQGNQHLDLHLLSARICITQGRYNDANDHLDALVGVKAFEGWSQLLKGSMALKEGRLEKAHTHFRQARQIMGDTLLVRMSLAHTYMALQEWDKAIPLLESMVLDETQLAGEEAAWYRQLLGGGARVHLDLLRARLAVDQWPESQRHLAALRDSELAPTAWALSISYLWERAKDREKAKQIVKLARERFPDDLTLALLEAGILEDDGESARATRFLREFAIANPQDERRQVAYVRWLIRKKEYQDAIDFLDEFEGHGNLSRKAQNTVMVYRAQALANSRQYDAAKQAAIKLRDNPGTSQVGYLLLAKLAFEEHDTERGSEYLDKARELDPNNAALALMITKLRTAEGDFEGVLNVGSEVLDVSQYRSQARESVSNALHQLAKSDGPERALERVDEMLAEKPDDLTLRVLKVDFLLQSNRFIDAMKELEDAERRDPENPNIPRLKTQALLSQGHFKPAIAEIEKVLAADPTNVPSLLLASQAALGAGDYTAAGAYADRARKEDLDAPEGYVLMAEALRKMDRIPAAISVLEAYSRRKPEDFAIYTTLAELQRDAGRADDAILTLRRARSRQPDDIRYLQTEIQLLLKEQRKGEAQVLARDYFASRGSPADMMAIAQAFADQKEVVDAQHWAEQALAKSKINERPRVHSFLGTIFMRRGMKEGNPTLLETARDHFAAAIDEQPYDIVAANNLAWLLIKQFDQPKDAIKVLEKARNNAPIDQLPVQFIDTLSMAYAKADFQQRATQLLKEAVTLHPREPQLLYQLAILLSDAQPVQAKDMLKRAIELGLEPDEEENARRQIARL